MMIAEIAVGVFIGQAARAVCLGLIETVRQRRRDYQQLTTGKRSFMGDVWNTIRMVY